MSARRAMALVQITGLLVAASLLTGGPAAAEHPNHAQGFRPEHVFDFSGIENVNLFNRNLTLTIPMGPSYPVGPDFSYQLVLTYTGNVWEWEGETQDGAQYLQALPRYRSNAGLGWELSLGRFESDVDPLSTNVGPTYESPDQSLHELFAGPLHLGEQTINGVDFTRDSTYLRYVPADGTVEFPDGLKRTFGPDGLSRIEDPFGNHLDISYGDRGADNVPMLWTLTDSYGRHHEIQFERQAITDGETGPEQSPLQEYRLVVKTVTLEAFDGTDAQYQFGYGNTVSFPRACNEPVLCPGTKICGDDSNVSYPVLTSVTLPDQSAYTIPVGAYLVDDTTSCGDRLLNGHLTRLDLPTGGAFEWTWADVVFPEESRKLGPLHLLSGGPNSPFRQAAGIASRRHLDSSNHVVGEWTYSSSRNDAPNCSKCEQQTDVTDPDGNKTSNFFSVYSCTPSGSTQCMKDAGWTSGEYGLPFTRQTSDGDGRFLSRQVRDASGSLLRSVYVRYENSGPGVNPRLASEKTVYEDDGSKEATTDLDDFDGLGHYRTMTETGTFPFASTRVTETDYNPNRSVSNIPGAGDPWVLGTYDTQTVTEGTETVTREACFDPNTGFLQRMRTWEGTSRGPHDVIVTRDQRSSDVSHESDGFVRRERTFGGDSANLGTTGGLCNLGLPASAPYGQDHTYVCGVLATSQWTGASFLSTDRTIRCRTGQVSASRDSSGLATSYDYDDLGRLTKEIPPSGLAQTVYIYSPYMPPGSQNPGPAKVAIRSKLGNQVLAGEQYTFDGLGRVVDEQRDLPGEVTAQRATTWTGRDQLASRETWHVKNAPAQGKTFYSGYDPFGRPGKITLPDGFEVGLGYSGERSRTTTVSIGEALDASHAVTTTDETTEEIYDRFGRLREVREPDDGAGVTKTRYTYDVQGNLTQVRQNVGTGLTTQHRDFTYDGRGFLTDESHPELGTTVHYSLFDPLGNPGRIQRGDWDLRYAYDSAGRLIQIKEPGAQCGDPATLGCWKEWTYAANNSLAGAHGKGKLAKMRRHNWVLLPADQDREQSARFDAWVEESYLYNDGTGGVTSVTTQVGTGSDADGSRPTFNYSLQHSPLGDVANRSYPSCSHVYCNQATTGRTVFQSFDEGYLTAIPGFATTIGYHPNGMVSKVEHGNGVTWIQENDPKGMARPFRIRTTGASENLNTGAYAYDGAGNVVRTGADRYLYDQVSRVEDARLGAYPVACGGSQTLTGTETGKQTYEVCGTIDAGPNYTVAGSGDVTLRAEGPIVFHDGFSVQSGGTLVAESGAAVNLSPPSEAQRTQSYEYDRFGNLKAVTTDGSRETVTTNPSTNRMSSSLFQYDSSGNVTQQPIGDGTFWSYRYDPFNMLWDVTRSDGRGWINIYGPGDERIWVVNWTDGPEPWNWKTTYTLRDLTGAPLRQYQLDGTDDTKDHWHLSRDYIWRGNTLLATVRDPGLSETDIYLHPDHLGTPRLLTGPGGAKDQTHLYFPFGEEATPLDPDAEALQFTGHERDDYAAGDTVDLDYMHARYFSAHLGRFTSVDPIGGMTGEPQSWNRYSYVKGNPVRYTDPQGLAEIDSCSSNQDGTSCSGEITVTGYFVPTRFANFVGFGGFLRNPGSLNSLPYLPRSMRGMTFKQALNTSVALGAGGDCSSDPNCMMLADVSSNHAFFEGVTWLDAQIAGGYVFGEGLGLLGRGVQRSFSLFSRAPAEEVASAEITGFTRHGINQVISREGRGVASRALLDAVANPQQVVPLANGTIRYVGRYATVVLNDKGSVVTAWAKSLAGTRIP